MTDIQTVQVAARDLQVGDTINGARIADIDHKMTPGVVYVWINDHTVNRRADMIFAHGDPVRITGHRSEVCITCGRPLTADDPVVTTLGPRCANHF